MQVPPEPGGARSDADADPGGHVTDVLALYYLSALAAAENDAVDRHLRDCAGCRATAREVCEVVAALALLGDDPRL